MALNNILAPREQVTTAAGNVLAGGKVFLFEPGTTTFVTSFRDSGMVAAHTNPVRLSGSGRANIWISRDVDMFIVPRTNVSDLIPTDVVIQELRANPDALGVDEAGGLVPNGSFEIDTDADLVPDSWTLASEAGATNELDTSESTDGAQSFRFTSNGSGGGSLVTDDFFPVNDVDPLRVNVDLRSTVAAVRNIVRVEWYDVSQVFISNTDPYDSTANPVTFTTQNLAAIPPALARFAKLRLIGIDPTVLLAGSTFFDRVSVFYPAVVTGVFDNITIQNNEIITTNINGDLNLRPNGTGSVVIERNALVAFRPSAAFAGVMELRSAGNTDAELREMIFQHQDGTGRGAIGHFGAGVMVLSNNIDGENSELRGRNLASAARVHVTMDPDLGVTLRYAGDDTDRLITHNLGQVQLRSTGNTDTENRLLLLEHQDGTLRGFVGYNAGSALILKNQIHGSLVALQGEDLAGVTRTLVQADPDGDATLFENGNDRLIADSLGAIIRRDTNDDVTDSRLRFQHDNLTDRALVGFLSTGDLLVRNQVHGGNLILDGENLAGGVIRMALGDPDFGFSTYFQNAIVTSTASAANGGLSVNNTLTGGGFERVLTVSDNSAAPFYKAVLAANEVYTSDILLTDIPGFDFSIATEGPNFFVRVVLFATHNAVLGTNPGLRVRLDQTGGGVATGVGQLNQILSGAIGSNDMDLNFTVAAIQLSNGARKKIVYEGGVSRSSGSPVVSFQAAQDTSSANVTTIFAGSFIEVWSE